MKFNKKLSPIVTELFMINRNFSVSLAFISKSYFKMSNQIRLIATCYFIMKIPNKREVQEIALNRSSDTEFKYLMKLFKDYVKEPF